MCGADITKCIPCTKHYFGSAHFVVTSCVLLELFQADVGLSDLARLSPVILGVCKFQYTPTVPITKQFEAQIARIPYPGFILAC